eukprot:gene16542-22583_t
MSVPDFNKDSFSSETIVEKIDSTITPVDNDVFCTSAIPNFSGNCSIMSIIQYLFDQGSKDPKILSNLLLAQDFFNTKLNEVKQFKCPENTAHRIDYPSIYMKESAELFREQLKNVDSNFSPLYPFIFYQHLRKAGGTGFCTLANNNLPKYAVPPYYCMPDNRGSLATPPWSNSSYLLKNIKSHRYRVVANEWDVFYSSFINLPNVILATTFRDPIDRWYSQYRFEHVEHRDGSKPGDNIQPMIKWYKGCVGWTMGTNYYVKTFVGTQDKYPPINTGNFYWTYHKYNKQKITWEMFQLALKNLRQFHLVLVTEWLNESAPLIESVLGWKTPPKQVLPHEVQAVRGNKKSKKAADNIPPQDYDYLRTENSFDLLFFELSKRLFLERIACKS